MPQKLSFSVENLGTSENPPAARKDYNKKATATANDKGNDFKCNYNSRSPSGMKTRKPKASAMAQWLVEGLHPTLRIVREGWGTREFGVRGVWKGEDLAVLAVYIPPFA
jgi:hypothetical protein